MKKIYYLIIFFISSLSFGQKFQQNKNSYYFSENKGQILDQNGKQNPSVKYLFNSNGLNVQIKKSGFSYDVYEVEKIKRKKKSDENDLLTSFQGKSQDEFYYQSKFHRVDIDFINANKNPEIIAEGKSNDYENYYNIPEKPEGITNVHRFQKITYKNLYPKIDLVFFKPNDTAKAIEYNFIVNPGGKISDIKLKFNGAKTELKNGKLSMQLRFGEMQENIPHSWIENPTSKQSIDVNFKDVGENTFGFASKIDSSDKMIVVDPVPNRTWGSFYGGDSTDYLSEITTDKNGNVYFTGNTFSTKNIATSGSFITTTNTSSTLDSYISKTDINGQKLWSTYLNGLTADIMVDKNFNVISTGNVYLQSNIGTPGTHQPNHSQYNNDAFILKFDSSGTRIWGTYYGGTGEEFIYSSTLDSNDNIIICGYTRSWTDIATTNVYQPIINGYNKDGFIAKININGQRIWGTYYGGSGDEIIYDVTIDENDNIYLVGETNSPDNIITSNAYQTAISGPKDGFLSSFDKNGNINFGTYFGGEGVDITTKIDYFNNKLAIIGTTTSQTRIATSTSLYTQPLYTSNFVNNFFTIFNYKGNWQTASYFYRNLTAVKFDYDGNFILAGYTTDDGLGTANSYQPKRYNYSEDAFAIKYDISNNTKIWGTYYGGEGFDIETTLYVDKNLKNIFLGGRTDSFQNISSPNSYQLKKYNNWEDGYIVKFNYCINNISISSNSPICPKSDLQLQASGGTSYSWSGPNGFTSTLQNPTIPNATPANSGTYTCQISGTGDCDGAFTIDVKVEDKTAPIPNQSSLPDLVGDCHFKITTIPTANDTCAGNIVATTSSPLQYSIPGTYIIIWKYDDGNGNTSSQSQKVTITSPPLPITTATQNFCKTKNPKISDIQITGQNIKWYDASGNLLTTNQNLTNSTYYATQTISGCESDKVSIKIAIDETPKPTANQNQEFCTTQLAKISDLKVTGTNLKFYDSLGNVLPTSTLLQDNTSYFVTQNVGNCESEKFEIKVNINPNAVPTNDYSEAFCNDTTNDFKNVNLTSYEPKFIAGTYIFEYFDQNNVAIPDKTSAKINLGQNIFNVKVSTADGCYKWIKLTLQLNPKPKLNLPTNAEYCKGLFVTLDAGSGFKTYTWSFNGVELIQFKNQRKIDINQAGSYTVKVTNYSDCESTSVIEVKQSQVAEITKVEIVNNNATVIMSNSGNFLYSLENKNWQTSNQFNNLNNGSYTVFVKTTLGCIIGEMNFTIFNIPNAFTPNGDGKNDTWKITGMQNYPNSEVKVWDRNGILVLSKITNGSFEWNGQFNGRQLPTGTYWYVIKISDGRLMNGYLLIKNRD